MQIAISDNCLKLIVHCPEVLLRLFHISGPNAKYLMGNQLKIYTIKTPSHKRQGDAVNPVW